MKRGFTLIEMLVVIAIIAILLGLLIPVLGAAQTKGRVAATAAMIRDLEMSLNNYQATEGIYPIKPGSSKRAIDDGSGSYSPPGYYQVPCVAKGSKSAGGENNAPLIKHLEDSGYSKISKGDLKGGKLMDRFSTPIVARFLVTSPAVGADRLLEKTYIWSYGPDQKNDVNAAGVYVNTGLPDYDKAEAANIDQVLVTGEDDITNWKR